MRFKKTISVLSLLLVLSIPMLVLIGCQLQQWYIRHEMEEKLERENLQTIILGAEDLIWEEEGKELMVNGTMFDVKQFEAMENGQWKLTGLFDHEETAIRKMSSDLAAKTGSSQKSSRLLAQTLSLTYFFERQTTPAFQLFLNTSTDYPMANQSAIVDVVLALLSPPPEC